MQLDHDLLALTAKERLELARLRRRQNKARRKQNPSGKVVGYGHVPNSPEIVAFLQEVTKRRQEASLATEKSPPRVSSRWRALLHTIWPRLRPKE